MSAFKGTPGPWRVERGDLVGVNGERVLLANSSMAFVSAFENPEAVANTRLCHAAPELLEALELLLHDCTPWTVKCAKDAIAKATGGDA